MNVSRGLFRAWVFASILWIIAASGVAYLIVVPEAVHGSFQAVGELKSAVKLKDVDWSAPFYQFMSSPSAEKLNVRFDPLDWQTKSGFDKDPRMIKVDFPDGSSAYMPASYNAEDRKYIAARFWDQRWWRWAYAIGVIALWALVPCGVIFALGFAMLWVGRGFKGT
jgi:hypothetical protein